MIEVKGYTACYGGINNENGMTLDFSKHIEVIKQVFQSLAAAQKPRLIAIEGRPGSGKTGFAAVLGQTGQNTCVIDVEKLRVNHDTPVIGALINDPSVTYIIDEVTLADKEVKTHITAHISKGGALVMLASRLGSEFNANCQQLILERDSLTAI